MSKGHLTDRTSVTPTARRARGAPEGVAQRARRGGSGGAEPPVEVAECAKESYTKR